MPTSNPLQISPILRYIMEHRREIRTALDIGVGFGKWGHLLREYLDVWGGAGKKFGQRNVTIDGVEPFPAYLTPGVRSFYDRIYETLWPSSEIIGGYDLILMIDVIEHFIKAVGIDAVKAAQSAGTRIITATPLLLGYGMQGATYGNEYERHRAVWTEEDFQKLGFRPLAIIPEWGNNAPGYVGVWEGS